MGLEIYDTDLYGVVYHGSTAGVCHFGGICSQAGETETGEERKA